MAEAAVTKSNDYAGMVDQMLAEVPPLQTEPGGLVMQAALVQAAGSFAIAASIARVGDLLETVIAKALAEEAADAARG